MKRIVVLFVLAYLFLYCNDSRGQTWRSIDGSLEGNGFSITTIESNAFSYKAKIRIHGFYDEEKHKNGITYHHIFFDIPSVLSEIGKPALPTINQLYALPYGNKCNVVIKELKWTNINIGKIIPYQDLLVKKDHEESFFSIDDKIYNSPVFSPSIVVVNDCGKWKGITSKNISLCPFIYYPQKDLLSILEEFVISISFENCGITSQTLPNDIGIFANSNILSTKNIKDISNNRSDNDNYLIIVGDIPNIINSQALNAFCQWKALKGYRTKVVTTETTGNTDTDIKEYISCSNGIEYVLFIGDYNKIPSHSLPNTHFQGYSSPMQSDYWYGCLDGGNDLLIDIPIGRFPVQSLNDLINIVEKTIRYESTPTGSNLKNLLVADRILQHRNTIDSIRTATFSYPKTFDYLYGGLPEYYGFNATNSELISKLNEGFNIVTYFGHGQTNAWGNEGIGWNSSCQFFYDSYIDSLNVNTNSIYFSVACLTGNIADTSCMMRTFLNSNHGAVAFLGATSISLFDANRTFLWKLYNNLLNNNICTYGDLLMASHIANIGVMPTNATINAFQYIWGGDPTLDIRPSMEPGCAFDNVSIRKNGNKISVNTDNIWSYDITFTTENGIILDSNHIMSPSGTINLPATNGFLIISKPGYTSYVAYLNVTDSNIQNVSFTTNTIYVNNGPIFVGNNVTTSMPYGDVTVTNNGKLTIQNSQGVTIVNGFECQTGGELEIK